MKYTIIVDKQPRTNSSSEKKTYEIDIEELRSKGDVYDSLIITKNEDYVMRRLSLSEFHVLNVLDEPIKELLPELNIELFEGDNYIYLLDETGNKFYAEYLIKNDFNDIYVKYNEMNSAINQSALQIELGVNQKLTGYSTTEEMNASILAKANEINLELGKKVDGDTITGAYLILKINGDTSEAKLNADKIELSANDVLNLLAGNTINLTSKKMTITSDIFNVEPDGNVTLKTNGLKVFKVENKDNDKKRVYITDSAIVVDSTTDLDRVSLGLDMDGNGFVDVSGGGSTSIKGSGITTPTLTQTSLREEKKNIEKLQNNALDIIKNIDIYKYNLKNEKDTDKKHIGFVIGETYNYSKEITSKNNDGVDLYSMAALDYKAVQEQQEQIEQLQEKDKLKDEIILNLIERIETLEKEVNNANS